VSAPDAAFLRPATADDLDAIATLWHDGWRDGHLGHVPVGLHAHRQPDDFRAMAPRLLGATTVADRDGHVVGFVTVVADEVEQVYVAADARGSGVAAALLDDGEASVARDHEVAWLSVVPGNARARAFYERQGWSDAGAFDYVAKTVGGTFVVPSLRYEKRVRP
jgi:ribosomal protein S18 acetylase RimI-like enzyme